jgi:transposase
MHRYSYGAKGEVAYMGIASPIMDQQKDEIIKDLRIQLSNQITATEHERQEKEQMRKERDDALVLANQKKEVAHWGIATPTSNQQKDRTIRDLRIQLSNQKAATEQERQEKEQMQKERDAALESQKQIGQSYFELQDKFKEKEIELKNTKAELELERKENVKNESLMDDLKEENDELLKLVLEQNIALENKKSKEKQNSGTSSSPPSMDGFKKEARTNSRDDAYDVGPDGTIIPRVKKPSGGQKFHKPHNLELPENLDELVAAGKIKVEIIDHRENKEGSYVERVVKDVRMEYVYIFHRYESIEDVPQEIKNNSLTYGDEFRKLSILLTNVGLIPEKRQAELIDAMTNGFLKPSSATIANFNKAFATSSAAIESEENIQKSFQDCDHLGVDDSSIKGTERPEYDEEDFTNATRKETININEYNKALTKISNVINTEKAKGTSFRLCARVYWNLLSVLLKAHPRKTLAGVVRDNILPNFKGYIVSDCESKFLWFGAFVYHCLCCVHLIRELRGLELLYMIPWGRKFIKLLQQMKAHKDYDLKRNINECDADLLEKYLRSWDELIAEGREILSKMNDKVLGYNKLSAILDRLEKCKIPYTNFIRNYALPFSNNEAERWLRLGKKKEDVSGCFRSWVGFVNYCMVRSILLTARKRKMSQSEVINSILKGNAVFA